MLGLKKTHNAGYILKNLSAVLACRTCRTSGMYQLARKAIKCVGSSFNILEQAFIQKIRKLSSFYPSTHIKLIKNNRKINAKPTSSRQVHEIQREGLIFLVWDSVSRIFSHKSLINL